MGGKARISASQWYSVGGSQGKLHVRQGVVSQYMRLRWREALYRQARGIISLLLNYLCRYRSSVVVRSAYPGFSNWSVTPPASHRTTFETRELYLHPVKYKKPQK